MSEKIREQKLAAQSMSVFVLTNYFNKRERQYSNSIRLQLPFPTNDSIQIVKRAIKGIRQIYRNGYRYKKIGIILTVLASPLLIPLIVNSSVPLILYVSAFSPSLNCKGSIPIPTRLDL